MAIWSAQLVGFYKAEIIEERRTWAAFTFLNLQGYHPWPSINDVTGCMHKVRLSVKTPVSIRDDDTEFVFVSAIKTNSQEKSGLNNENIQKHSEFGAGTQKTILNFFQHAFICLFW